MNDNIFLNYFRLQRKGIFLRLMNSQGFSLAEMMVTAVIGLMVMVAVLGMDILVKQNYLVGATLLEIQGGSRNAMDWMYKDILVASQLEDAITIDGENYLTQDNQLILRIPSIDDDSEVIDDTFDYVVYHLIENTSLSLSRIIDADVASSRTDESRIITDNINDLNFTYEGTQLSEIDDVTTLSNVGIELALNKTTPLGTEVEEALSIVAKLRNN